MKSVTEFNYFTLSKGLAAKAALTTDGKAAEEIQASLGESFKFEGEKLTHFVNALDVVAQNNNNTLKRVVVMSLNEGEKAPAKAVQVEAFHYVPEFVATAKPVVAEEAHGKGGRGGKGRGQGGRGGGDKKGGSPWGMSPEEIAAKKGKTPAAPKA
ncbi:hypothetical protein [Bdellovibrio sp. KM01]|uniref:hypothetical protein n=1 Tax=Bdellovibrio sp. KM01 TaxID=2748865 RepID=UPI0015E990A5|nr:hypothetical protein [Bdellovibrio sp. KM01]QLY24175.1 hypothetical protein HW988_11950 [Bdellovibrio sp. KM01]